MIGRITARRGKAVRGLALLAGLGLLAACEEGQMPGFLQARDAAPAEDGAVTRAGGTVERDIEAPEIFQASEAGLWDGRPSLGGVWVAHPDVKDPERVIIRNEQNGQFVIGALFRREREAPGPRFQVSSDAAAALGMLAGAPANLNVVALRREEVAPEPASDPVEPAESAALPAPSDISEGPIDPVAATAAAALDAPEATPSAAPAPAPTPAAAPAAPPRPASALEKPFIQIGIFSVEQNARNTATAMRQAGMVPTVKQQSSSGKTFWRVLVGPAQSKSELSTLLKKIKGTGFTDAYAVTN
ncbi:SPOR domain-containing protein [Aestuariicoccus sp. MJ-SS9]|uniref:SPOR domain-containing protein n=1 Tax=Aestuariicoccus sp. MJ-SS9 TaxID=3079855 RepID=UPI0029063A74|nr:SPOR domain-containing protein [Aestuariicoccus sp. MJ-SS9]MDU8911985.1 SPOR domain-containing protein [Aestuariicoccus sp. MJ-SS9]